MIFTTARTSHVAEVTSIVKVWPTVIRMRIEVLSDVKCAAGLEVYNSSLRIMRH
jgi:hypothetical protein